MPTRWQSRRRGGAEDLGGITEAADGEVAAVIGDEEVDAGVAADMFDVAGMIAEAVIDAVAGGDVAAAAAGSDPDPKIAGLRRTHGLAAAALAQMLLRKRRKRSQRPEREARIQTAAEAQLMRCPPAQQRLRQRRLPLQRAKSW